MSVLGKLLGLPLARLLILVGLDLVLLFVSSSLAFLTRLEEIPWERLYPLLIFLGAVRVPLLLVSGSYSVSLLYTSLRDMFRILGLVTLTSIFAVGAVAWSRQTDWVMERVPFGVIAIEWAFACLLFSAGRLSRRLYRMLTQKKLGKRTLIIGAGAAAEQLIRSMFSTKGFDHVPLALLDDDPGKFNTTIHGVRVVGTTGDIERIVAKYRIESVVVAIPTAPSRLVRQWFDLSRRAGVSDVLILPDISEILNDQVSVRDIRKVALQDLLGREAVQIDLSAVKQILTGKCVMVTGGAGSIGSEICRQVARLGPAKLVILDQDETGLFYVEQELRSAFPRVSLVPIVADITNALRIRTCLVEHAPGVLFHAAAYKHVPMMEENPDEAIRNNISGTLIVARAAEESGVERFVFISSDKAVEPFSVMGKTKRIGELLMSELCRSSRTRFMSVRFGNVMGSRGSVIETFQKQIQAGGPVTVTHADMRRYFMLTSEAVLLVLQAAALGRGGETFILDMGQPIRITDLANEMIRLAGFESGQSIEIVYTGLRPGERLEEKLHFDDEILDRTAHSKISLARGPQAANGVVVRIEEFQSGKLAKKSIEFLDLLLEASVVTRA